MAMAISVPLYTVDDLEHFPDDGNRYELLDGVLLVTPQAAAPHQIVVSRIQSELAASLQKPGLAHVVGPGAVVRDSIPWKIAGAEVIIELHEVFAGLL